jgi:baseplate J-like protein
LADQLRFGVTPDGFVLKGIDRIVADQQGRARTMFGDDVDLSSGSALRKVMDAVAWDAHDLWRGLEAQYYSLFVTTAAGPSLDLLGTDLGRDRRSLQATGSVTLTLVNGAPGRRYALPEGTVVETVAVPHLRFRLTALVTLSADQPSATATVQAMDRGTASNLAPGQVLQVNAAYAQLSLNLGQAQVTGANPAAFAGGELSEGDADYRARLLGVPRSIWTLDALLAAVLELNGVRDAAAFDPLGGVDVSQSYFNLFLFGERAFSRERLLASPYYFDVVVATQPGWPWTTAGGVTGVFDEVLAAVRALRPVSVFPNIVQADSVELGVRMTLVVEGGSDADAIRAQIVSAIHASVNTLTIGRGVQCSDVLLLARTAPGVVDVQNLHLRRCPPVFAGVNFDGAVFGEMVEMAVGENVPLGPHEIAHFTIDSPLLDIQVSRP